MRIHSDTLTTVDIVNVVSKFKGIGVMGMSGHGSRSRRAAIEFALSGSGRHGGQWGGLDYPAATWDEWGIVLNALFNADPNAIIPRVYESAEHFHWVTGGRYRTLTMQDQHVRHNWLSGDAGGRSITGTYYVQSCKCGAILRRMAYGHTFSTDVAHEFDGVV